MSGTVTPAVPVAPVTPPVAETPPPAADPAVTPPVAETPPPAADPAVTPPASEPGTLGPEGEKALKIWKDRAKAAEHEAKELKKAGLSDAEKAVSDAHDAGRTEALAETNGRLFNAELRAAVAGKLNAQAIKDLTHSPDIAASLLGFEDIPVTATGDIDGEAISQAVDAYVAARPFLAADATSQPGAIDQGARPPAPVKGIDEQIAEAEAAGNWTLSGQLKMVRMAQQQAAV